MRPYLAIIRDSFHEALASRVLWILIVILTLLLAAITPLGISQRSNWMLKSGDITNAAALLKKLKTQVERDRPSPGQRIFELADDDLKSQLTQAPRKGANQAGGQASGERSGDERPNDSRPGGDQLATDLNAMLRRADFFNKPDWAAISLGKEAKGLLEQGLDQLPRERLARFNRLALDAAFPGEVAPVGPPQVQFKYLAWNLGGSLPLEHKDVASVLDRSLLKFMEAVLGIAGILAAVVVTASIIPQTFEAGAIDLLLSKPVTRSLVFLTKFAGGCVYILLIASWLIGGIWLILGVRLDVWIPRLLLCIPVYLFLFAIYYSLSALAGVIWKNAIVSVVMAIVFWFVCFSVGIAKEALEAFVINPARLVKIVPAGESLLAVNESGSIVRWRETGSTWSDVFQAGEDGNPRFPFGLIGSLIGPVYDASHQRLLAMDKPLAQFGPMASQSPLLIGKPTQDWRRINGPSVPAGAEALLVDQHGVPLVVTPQAVFRLKGDAEAKPQPMKVLGIELPLPGEGPKFVEASPALRLSTPLSAAQDAATSELAIFDGRRLLLLAAGDKEPYQTRVELELDDYQAGLVAYAGQTLALALADGSVQFYDPTDLRLKQTIALEKPNTPRFIAAAPDGRWVAVVFHGGRLWLYDTQQDAEVDLSAAGFSDVSAATFSGPNLLLVADENTRVSDFDLAAKRVDSRRQPRLSTWEATYRYAVRPLYVVFPKPGKLDYLVHYVLTGETNTPIPGSNKNELSEKREKIDVWGPIWSNLAFLAIVLAIGCVYVARKDF